MKVLICGDRYWHENGTIEEYIKSLPKDTVIIQGTCRGVDFIARRLARQHGLEVLDFFAKWDVYGNAAGPIRNTQMLDEGKPDQVVAFHNAIKKSKGTADMLRQSRERGVPTEIRCSKY